MKKIIFLIFSIIIVVLLYKKSFKDDIVIPDESIRIRIIANSNSYNDQHLKMIIKNNLQAKLNFLLKNSKTKNESSKILYSNLDEINNTIGSLLLENNSDLEYDVSLGSNYFPQKKYKGIVYDEGYYDSLVIRLGKASGDNWWCVLFPPLCLNEVDEKNMDEIEYKSYIYEVLSNYF